MNWIKYFFIASVTMPSLWAESSPSPQVDSKPAFPNILIVLADDLGYGDVGCYGQTRIQTPEIDALARQGIRFTHGYAGATVCAPSRAVLMTGIHGGRVRVRGNGPPHAQSLNADDVTIATILKKAGYHTALIGKWGLADAEMTPEGLPNHQGFDHFFGYLDQVHAHNHFPSWLWRNQEKVSLKNTVPNELKSGGGVSSNRIESSQELFTSEAIQWIRQHTQNQPEQPFFLYFSSVIPHANNEAGKRGMEVKNYGIYEDRDWPDAQKGFAAMVTQLDEDLRKIRKTLHDLGQLDNTLIIFTSDNGPHREGGNDPDFFDSNGPFSGIKRSLTDGGIRVPWIVSWPKAINNASVSDTTIHFSDVLPTLADLTGIEIPQNVTGESFLPLLQGQAQPELNDRHLYWEFFEGGFRQASRWKQWKAIRRQVGGKLHLYDVMNDLAEKNDLSDQHPDIIKKFEQFFSSARTDHPYWKIPTPESKAQKP